MPLHYYPSLIVLALLAFYVFWSGRQTFRRQRPAPSNIAPIGHVRLKDDLSNSPGRRKDDEVGGEG